ncbi:tRNA(fMet)-specific endonuclease VapC [soil metagenome]
MPRFMLDTDISSYVMKRSSAAVLDRLRETAVAEVCVSVITKAELLYGVELSPRPEKDRAALEAFLLHVETLEFQDIGAVHYAAIRANLKRRGQLIGANDLLIAAHARSLDLVLVTNNTAEFSRVTDLKLENWTQPQ